MLSTSPEKKQDVPATPSTIPLKRKSPAICASTPQYVTSQETLADVRKKLRPVAQPQPKTEPAVVARQKHNSKTNIYNRYYKVDLFDHYLLFLISKRDDLVSINHYLYLMTKQTLYRILPKWSVDPDSAPEPSLLQETVAARELLFNHPVRVARAFTPEEMVRMANHEAFIKPLIHERLKILRNALHDDDSDAE
jgi:hypothetical protein